MYAALGGDELHVYILDPRKQCMHNAHDFIKQLLFWSACIQRNGKLSNKNDLFVFMKNSVTILWTLPHQHRNMLGAFMCKYDKRCSYNMHYVCCKFGLREQCFHTNNTYESQHMYMQEFYTNVMLYGKQKMIHLFYTENLNKWVRWSEFV